MSNLYYRSPHLLILTLILIVGGGVGAYLKMPRLEDPQPSIRWGYVFVPMPGAAAERVESQITEPIEGAVREIAGVESTQSWSRNGRSLVMVRLKDQVVDVDASWTELRDKLNDVAGELPPEAGRPEIVNEDGWWAKTLVVGLNWQADAPAEPAVLTRLAKELENRLRQIPGTNRINLVGAAEEEIRVEVRPDELAARGLTVTDVVEQIRQSDAKVPGAPVRTPSSELLVDVAGDLETLEQVRRVPIQQGEGGGVVRLTDVADVTQAAQDPPTSLVLIDGRPGVALAVRMDPTLRIDAWIAAVRQAVAEFQRDTPPGVDCEILFDQSVYTNRRIDQLLTNLMQGVALVAVVIFFAMGWKAVLPVGTALPLAILMVAGGLKLLGYGIEQMSVAGLIVAIGLLIDNPIITVDDLMRRLRAGVPPEEAVSQTVHALWAPLLGSTLTSMFAFSATILLAGSTGEFLQSMGVSVCLALTSSLFLALTVAPALAAHVYRLTVGTRRAQAESGSDEAEAEPEPWWSRGVGSSALLTVYRATLGRLTVHPLQGIGLCLVLPLLGFGSALLVDEQFFPSAERDHFQIHLRLPSDAPLEQTRRTALAVRETLLEHPHVERVNWYVGTNSPKVHYSMVFGQHGLSHYAHGIVSVTDQRHTPGVIRDVQARLDREFPGVQAIAVSFEQGMPTLAPIEVRISGPDVRELQRLGEEVRGVFATLPAVAHTRPTLLAGHPKLLLSVDEEEARMAGLSRTLIALRLGSGLYGSVGGSMLQDTEELPVRVLLADTDGGGPGRLPSEEIVGHSPVPGMSPGPTPLAALGRTERVADLASIPRYNGVRCNTIEGYVRAGASPIEAEAAFRTALAESDFELPPGYRIDYGGAKMERDNAVAQLLSNFWLLALLIFATVVLTFRSFRLAGIVFAVAVLSMGFGFLSLWATGYPFGMIAIVGMLGMVGLAINDTIVVLSELQHDPGAAAGDPDRVREVVVRATRHVLSTSITTVAGFVPLLIAGGEFWPPLAVVIAGGVCGATLLALYLAPAAFLLTTPRPPQQGELN